MKDMVVCIADFFVGGVDEYGNRLPIFRNVYTVRGTCIDPASGVPGIFLEEIVNAPKPTEPDGQMLELAFSPDHFRPVKPTDISGLTKFAPAPCEVA